MAAVAGGVGWQWLLTDYLFLQRAVAVGDVTCVVDALHDLLSGDRHWMGAGAVKEIQCCCAGL